MSTKAEQKERSHRDILSSAARLLRERGVAGMSVGEVMRRAGLTVGGFYAHFPSKEHLVGEALRCAMGQRREELRAAARGRPPAELARLVLRSYLSRGHRDEPGTGCPLPAVVGAMAAGDDAGREALAEELSETAAALGELLPRTGLSPRHLSLGLIALMYGGLSLSRALRGSALSEELLRACRAFGDAALGAAPGKE